MKKYLFIILLCITSFLSVGCHKNYGDGGGITATQTETLTSYDDKGNVKDVKQVTTSTTVSQPQNPDKPATLNQTINDKGVQINANSGSGYNIASIVESMNLLKIPMYAGIALILVGLLAGWLTKNIVWGGIIGGVGIAMIVGTYLLSAYAVYFLLGLGILFIFGIYLLWDYVRNVKANEENIELIELCLKEGLISDEEFKKLANLAQSQSTKKIVDKIQRKLDK